MTNNKTFMGNFYSYEDSKVVVVLAPYELTSTYGKGQEKGPNAILDASMQVELYDIEFGMEFVDELAPFVLDELKIQNLPPKNAIDEVERACTKIFEDKKFPLVLGGEHSISLGPILAAKKYYDDLSVLHIDAHADMRNEYEDSKYSHACVMARVREEVLAVSVGIRSYSVDEANVIREKYCDVVFGPKLNDEIIDKIISNLHSKNVYITFDVDGLDPSIIPATGTPEPGGLLWDETLRLLKKVCQQKNVVGLDIVELAPRKNEIISDFACAKLAYKLCGYSLLQK